MKNRSENGANEMTNQATKPQCDSNTQERDHPMTSYTVNYPEMIVHRTGCADLAKVPNRHADTTSVVEATDLIAALQSELADDLGALGYTVDDFDVKPCAVQAAAR
jgi:hypothetical protein